MRIISSIFVPALTALAACLCSATSIPQGGGLPLVYSIDTSKGRVEILQVVPGPINSSTSNPEMGYYLFGSLSGGADSFELNGNLYQATSGISNGRVTFPFGFVVQMDENGVIEWVQFISASFNTTVRSISLNSAESSEPAVVTGYAWGSGWVDGVYVNASGTLVQNGIVVTDLLPVPDWQKSFLLNPNPMDPPFPWGILGDVALNETYAKLPGGYFAPLSGPKYDPTNANPGSLDPNRISMDFTPRMGGVSITPGVGIAVTANFGNAHYFFRGRSGELSFATPSDQVTQQQVAEYQQSFLGLESIQPRLFFTGPGPDIRTKEASIQEGMSIVGVFNFDGDFKQSAGAISVMPRTAFSAGFDDTKFNFQNSYNSTPGDLAPTYFTDASIAPQQNAIAITGFHDIANQQNPGKNGSSDYLIGPNAGPFVSNRGTYANDSSYTINYTITVRQNATTTSSQTTGLDLIQYPVGLKNSNGAINDQGDFHETEYFTNRYVPFLTLIEIDGGFVPNGTITTEDMVPGNLTLDTGDFPGWWGTMPLRLAYNDAGQIAIAVAAPFSGQNQSVKSSDVSPLSTVTVNGFPKLLTMAAYQPATQQIAYSDFAQGMLAQVVYPSNIIFNGNQAYMSATGAVFSNYFEFTNQGTAPDTYDVYVPVIMDLLSSTAWDPAINLYDTIEYTNTEIFGTSNDLYNFAVRNNAYLSEIASPLSGLNVPHMSQSLLTRWQLDTLNNTIQIQDGWMVTGQVVDYATTPRSFPPVNDNAFIQHSFVGDLSLTFDGRLIVPFKLTGFSVASNDSASLPLSTTWNINGSNSISNAVHGLGIGNPASTVTRKFANDTVIGILDTDDDANWQTILQLSDVITTDYLDTSTLVALGSNDEFIVINDLEPSQSAKFIANPNLTVQGGVSPTSGNLINGFQSYVNYSPNASNNPLSLVNGYEVLVSAPSFVDPWTFQGLEPGIHVVRENSTVDIKAPYQVYKNIRGDTIEVLADSHQQLSLPPSVHRMRASFNRFTSGEGTTLTSNQKTTLNVSSDTQINALFDIEYDTQRSTTITPSGYFIDTDFNLIPVPEPSGDDYWTAANDVASPSVKGSVPVPTQENNGVIQGQRFVVKQFAGTLFPVRYGLQMTNQNEYLELGPAKLLNNVLESSNASTGVTFDVVMQFDTEQATSSDPLHNMELFQVYAASGASLNFWTQYNDTTGKVDISLTLYNPAVSTNTDKYNYTEVVASVDPAVSGTLSFCFYDDNGTLTCNSWYTSDSSQGGNYSDDGQILDSSRVTQIGSTTITETNHGASASLGWATVMEPLREGQLYFGPYNFQWSVNDTNMFIEQIRVWETGNWAGSEADTVANQQAGLLTVVNKPLTGQESNLLAGWVFDVYEGTEELDITDNQYVASLVGFSGYPYVAKVATQPSSSSDIAIDNVVTFLSEPNPPTQARFSLATYNQTGPMDLSVVLEHQFEINVSTTQLEGSAPTLPLVLVADDLESLEVLLGLQAPAGQTELPDSVSFTADNIATYGPNATRTGAGTYYLSNGKYIALGTFEKGADGQQVRGWELESGISGSANVQGGLSTTPLRSVAVSSATLPDGTTTSGTFYFFPPEALTQPIRLTWTFDNPVFYLVDGEAPNSLPSGGPLKVGQALDLTANVLTANSGSQSILEAVADAYGLSTTLALSDIVNITNPRLELISSPSTDINADGMVRWSPKSQKLFCFEPGVLLVEWPTSRQTSTGATVYVTIVIEIDWPTPSDTDQFGKPILVDMVLGTGPVLLDPNPGDAYRFHSLVFWSGPLANTSHIKQETAGNALIVDHPGYTVLWYLTSDTPATETDSQGDTVATPSPGSRPPSTSIENNYWSIKVINSVDWEDSLANTTTDSDGNTIRLYEEDLDPVPAKIGMPVPDSVTSASDSSVTVKLDQAQLGTGFLIYDDTDSDALGGNLGAKDFGIGDLVPVNVGKYQSISSSTTPAGLPSGAIYPVNLQQFNSPTAQYMDASGNMVTLAPGTPQFQRYMDQRVVVVWYEVVDGSYWPYRAVEYIPELPDSTAEYDGVITIGSGLGSMTPVLAKNTNGEIVFTSQSDGVLTATHFPDAAVYRQGDASKPGYNPNEEHAFLAAPPLNLNSNATFAAFDFPVVNDSDNVIYALQTAFNLSPETTNSSKDIPLATSPPFVLLDYTDPNSGENKMKIYKVLMQETYNKADNTTVAVSSSFSGNLAGSLAQAPHPVQLQGAMNADSGTLLATSAGSDTQSWFQDRTQLYWNLTGDSSHDASLYYQVSQSFDTPSPSTTSVNLFSAGSYIPYAIQSISDVASYAAAQANFQASNAAGQDPPVPPPTLPVPPTLTLSISWPEDTPVLQMGDTLTYPKEDANGNPLPGVLQWNNGQVIYDGANQPSDTELSTAASYASKSAVVTNSSVRLVQAMETLEVDVPFEKYGLTDADLDEFNTSILGDTGKTFQKFASSSGGQLYHFKLLPSDLATRVGYDSASQRLSIQGLINGIELGGKNFNAQPPGASVLSPNIMSGQELATSLENLVEATSGSATASNSWEIYADSATNLALGKAFREALMNLYLLGRGVYDETADGSLGKSAIFNDSRAAPDDGSWFVGIGPYLPNSNLTDTDNNDFAYQASEQTGPGLALFTNFGVYQAASIPTEDYYVVLAQNNAKGTTDPVTLEVLKVSFGDLATGQITVQEPSDPFDPQLTLRSNLDFGGNDTHFTQPSINTYISSSSTSSVTFPGQSDVTNLLDFTWIYTEPNPDFQGFPQPPQKPEQQFSTTTLTSVKGDVTWNVLTAANQTGSKIFLEESGSGTSSTFQLLSDGYYYTRYTLQDIASNYHYSNWAGAANSNPMVETWASAYSNDYEGLYVPQLATSWVARVLDAINPYENRYTDFVSTSAPEAWSSIIQQAGPPPSGTVALNDDPAYIQSVGLIELYDTIYNRAYELATSIAGGLSDPERADLSQTLLMAAQRIALLYKLLGNEAYADAMDPLIGTLHMGVDPNFPAEGDGPPVDNLNAISLPPTIFAFQDMLNSQGEEKMTLLRGRALADTQTSEASSASTGAAPVHNRLYWNYTNGLGQIAYQINYAIVDFNYDGFLNYLDGQTQYPQGHGDAWGHYTTALKYYYDIIALTNLPWSSGPEPVSIEGAVIDVNFWNERKFADTASARMETGLAILEAAYKQQYTEDSAAQWLGYKDTNEFRAWGVDGWASRVGQGGVLDWAVSNAMLPAEPAPSAGTFTLSINTDTTSKQTLTVTNTNTSDTIAQFATLLETELAREMNSGAPAIKAGTLAGDPVLIFNWPTNNWTLTAARYEASGANAQTIESSLLTEFTDNSLPSYVNQQALLFDTSITTLPAGTLTLTVESTDWQSTGPIEFSTTYATLASNIQAALDDVLGSGSVVVEGGSANETLIPTVSLNASSPGNTRVVSADPSGLAEQSVVIVNTLQDGSQTIKFRQNKVDYANIDREAVEDLGLIAARHRYVQDFIDGVDAGLNPLGVDSETVPFDLDGNALVNPERPTLVRTQFEQLYDRAMVTWNLAYDILEYANIQKANLRQVEHDTEQLRLEITTKDFFYRNLLIRYFGSPYSGLIGPGQPYEADYNGPDYFFYPFIDVIDATQNAPDPSTELTTYLSKSSFKVPLSSISTNADNTQTFLANAYQSFLGDEHGTALNFPSPGGTIEEAIEIVQPLSASDYAFLAPEAWGSRASPGQMQIALTKVVRAESELNHAISKYSAHAESIITFIQLYEYTLHQKADIFLYKETLGEAINLLKTLKSNQDALGNAYRFIGDAQKETKSDVTNTTPTIFGLSNNIAAAGLKELLQEIESGAEKKLGFLKDSGDGALEAGGAKTGYIQTRIAAAGAFASEIYYNFAAEALRLSEDTTIESAKFNEAFVKPLEKIEELLNKEFLLRREVQTKVESLRLAVEEYKNIENEGQRHWQDRIGWNRKLSEATQKHKTLDMAFRIERNAALQKYREAFALAQRYALLAAKAYDYETVLPDNDPYSAKHIINDIMNAEYLGVRDSDTDVPVYGNGGLGDALLWMKTNFEAIKHQNGLNAPTFDHMAISLAEQLANVRSLDQAPLWTQLLSGDPYTTNGNFTYYDDLNDNPVYRTHCRPYGASSGDAVPGYVISFPMTVEAGKNIFGKSLQGGDSAYDPTRYSTRIFSHAVEFQGYPTSSLATTPRYYLVPSGTDILGVPGDNDYQTRAFNVLEQRLPLGLNPSTLNLADPEWSPASSLLDSEFGKIRRYSASDAFVNVSPPDIDDFSAVRFSTDIRLAGRSVANTQWNLIIPITSMIDTADTAAGRSEFAAIRDIVLHLYTYSYSGN